MIAPMETASWTAPEEKAQSLSKESRERTENEGRTEPETILNDKGMPETSKREKYEVTSTLWRTVKVAVSARATN